MIIAPGMKKCEMCDGMMHLMWSANGINWYYMLDKNPTSDDVEIRLHCKDCGHVADPFEDPGVREYFNSMKLYIINAMFKKGIYSYKK